MASRQYCTIAQIQNYLLYTIKEYFQPQVLEWIEQMSQYIEQESGRFFIADTDATEKLYDGDGEDSTIIDDCIEITGVEISEVATDYLKYPSNKLPTTTIRLESGVFIKGDQNVAVTAKWGYSEEVPANISFACVVLVSGIINKSLSHEGEISSITMGRHTVSYKDDKQLEDFENTKKILETYKRYN